MSNEKKLIQELQRSTVQALCDEDLYNVNGGKKNPEKVGLIFTSIIGAIGVGIGVVAAIKLASTKEKLKEVNKAYYNAQCKLDKIAEVARRIDHVVVYTDPVEEIDELGGVVMGVRQILGDKV